MGGGAADLLSTVDTRDVRRRWQSRAATRHHASHDPDTGGSNVTVVDQILSVKQLILVTIN